MGFVAYGERAVLRPAVADVGLQETPGSRAGFAVPEIQNLGGVGAPGWGGFGTGVRQLPLGIAYVTDATLLADARLGLAKNACVAIGTGDEMA